MDKGYEVLFMVDPLDEYVMQNVNEYDDKEFANVSKADLKLSESDTKAAKKAEKALRVRAARRGARSGGGGQGLGDWGWAHGGADGGWTLPAIAVFEVSAWGPGSPPPLQQRAPSHR